jgi:hypothetical protein
LYTDENCTPLLAAMTSPLSRRMAAWNDISGRVLASKKREATTLPVHSSTSPRSDCWIRVRSEAPVMFLAAGRSICAR